jgi:DNA modification methylase
VAEREPRAAAVRGTSTSSFGAGRREAHDASRFYERFSAPEVTTDDSVTSTVIDDLFVHGDARAMGEEVPDGSVALVVTSPPYFAGKEYELALGPGHVPRSYLGYLAMLESVLARCVEKLEPGGRMAVNVANLGRRPYRSLSADVVRILQDDLGLLLRGEVIWLKGRGQSGSCAWGSFRSATNPVLRDTTERIIIASKGRFDRARRPDLRVVERLPHEDSIGNDEFLEATLDVWDIPPESATRVGHPAPFPVALPRRLIELYTYRGDLILDPFLGSGSTAVAAVQAGRRCAGYETDGRYVDLARQRVRDERARIAGGNGAPAWARGVGKAARAYAVDVVEGAGFKITHRDRRIARLGTTVAIVADDRAGKPWYFDVTGAFTATRGGLIRSDTLWRCLGRAAVLRAGGFAPLVLLTSELPPPRSEGDKSLRAGGVGLFFDAIEMTGNGDRRRLARYAAGRARRPVAGFWTPEEIAASGDTGSG